MKVIGEIIKLLLDEKGWNQNNLANKAELEAHHISELINNKRSRTTYQTLEKIAKALNVSLDVFFLHVPYQGGKILFNICQRYCMTVNNTPLKKII